MINKARRLTAVLLVIITVTMWGLPAYAITSAGACAIDALTGEVLYEKNPDTPLAPASMTKVMTAYIVFDKISKGELTKDTMITCTENSARLSRDSVATNVPLNAGEQYSVDELLHVIMLPSACASCTLVGEYISGTEAEFALLMNEYAKDLGLDAYYEDASGLSDNNRITPRSMALLGAKLINNFPDVLSYTSKTSYNFRGRWYNNTNALLQGKSYEYYGADGLKTGTTTLAGKCLTATAERNGDRVVAVTMRSTSGSARYTDITEILNSAFSKISARGAFANDLHMYIDGHEIHSYYCTGGTGAVILAEDLASYGFDVSYDADTKTVTLTRNIQNATAPVVRNHTNGQKFAKIVSGNQLRVEIDDNGYYYSFDKVFDLNGYAGIYVDELANLYAYRWDNEAMSGHFNLK